MTEDAISVAGTPASDANVSPSPEAPQAPKVEGNEAVPSPAARESGDSDVVKPVQSRFDELTRYRRDAERRAEAAEKREAALLQLLEKDREDAPRRAHAAPAPGPKTLADFGYDEAAFTAHVLSENKRIAREAVAEELKQERAKEAAKGRQSQFEKRATDFAKTVDDYEDVVRNPSLSITQAMAEVIAESDDGPALAYHLGKNPDKAERIASLSPLAAARELGRLEVQLAAEREKAKAKPAVSAAPPPTPTIAAADPLVQKDPAQMSDVEFAKWRKRQIAQRR